MHGAPFSARTPSPMESTLPPSIASDSKPATSAATKRPAKGLEFWGGSFIADPFGQIVAEAPHDKEAILLAEVDLHRIEDVRRNWPFWRDRRIDAYAPITQRFLV